MKNLKSTEPTNLQEHYGWCADIYEGEESTCKTDICTVWGSTEEELNYRVTMIKKAYEMREALKESVNILEHIHLKDLGVKHLGFSEEFIMKLNNWKSLLKEIKS